MVDGDTDELSRCGSSIDSYKPVAAAGSAGDGGVGSDSTVLRGCK